jgi:hypothetical protein
MISTSGGSQRDPNEFLTSYARGVEQAIEDLKFARIPGAGARALHGEEGMDIKEQAQKGVLRLG